MSTTSALKTQMDTAAAANPVPWTTTEAAVEVIKIACDGIATDTAGLATSAKQDTGNTAVSAFTTANHTDLLAVIAKEETLRVLLASTDGKTPALGAAAGTAAVPVVQNFESTTGTLTAINQTVVLPCKNIPYVLCDVRGTFTASWTIDGLLADAATWVSIKQTYEALSGSPYAAYDPSGATSSNRSLLAVNSGFLQIRVKCTAYTSGTANVNLCGASAISNFSPLLTGFNNWNENGSTSICTLLNNSGASDRALAVCPVKQGSGGLVRERIADTFKNVSATIATEQTIWTPTSGKKFRLMGFVLTQGVLANAITLKDNTAGTTILTIPANTLGTALVSPPMGNGILSAAANNVLTATGGTGQTISGYVFGTEE